MTPNLRIKLLGEFRLLLDEQPLTSVITRRQQALLAYLLLHRHGSQSRQYVAYQFWPDSAEGQAQTNLRKLFFQLRNVLPSAESFLDADSQSLSWRHDAPFTLDVAELERALDSLEQTSTPDVATVQQVMMLYQGHLLPACYEEWLLPIRQALHERVVNTLTQAITGLEAQHEFQVALRAAEHLLRLDPLHEAAYRQLMHLRMLSGDRAGALRIYHECVTKLEQELEVSPAGETQALYQRLLKLDGEPTPVLPPVTGQRHEYVPLVGRKQEWHLLQQAWSQMSSQRPHLITIWGEAGMGKTRLVEELLHWARLRPGSVAYARAYAAEGALAYGPLTEWLRSVALRPVLTQLEDIWQTELARLVPELLTTHPGLTPPIPMTDDWQRQRFHEALARAVFAAPSPRLLVLDDLQWCDAETLAWLRYLLRFDPQARLLVVGAARREEVDETHPLTELLHHLRHEQQYQEIQLAPLSLGETAEIVHRLAGEGLGRWAEQLYRESEGNPLFVLEFARAQMERQAVAEAEEILSTPGEELVAPLPPRLQALIHARLARLSPAAQELVGLAATIGRSFTFAVLAAASQYEEDRLVRSLDELWQRRIVREQGTDAYDFGHDRIREVAFARISTARQRLLHRHVAEALERVYASYPEEYYGQLATHYEQGGLPERARHYLRRAGERAAARFTNVEAIRLFGRALALTPDGNLDERYDLLLARQHLYHLLGKHEEEGQDLASLRNLLALFENSLQDARRRRAQVALRQARYYHRLGEHKLAIDAIQAAIAAAQACQAADLEAEGIYLWAWILWSLSDFHSARSHLERLLIMARAFGLTHLEASALEYLAAIGTFTSMRAIEIESYLEQSLALSQQRNDPIGISHMMNKLGYLIVAQGQGHYDRARAYYEEGVRICHTIGYVWQEIVLLTNFGVLLMLQGDYGGAKSNLRQSVQLAHMAGEARREGVALNCLGELLLNEGNFADAKSYHEASLRILDKSGDQHFKLRTVSDLGLLYHYDGEHELAHSFEQEAIRIAREMGDKRQEGYALTRLGHILVVLSRLGEATEAYQQAFALHQAMGQTNRSLQPLAGLAHIAFCEGSPEQALATLEPVLLHLPSQSLDCTEEVFHVYLVCYHVLMANQDPRAQQILQLAYTQLQSRASTLVAEEHRQIFWSVPAHEFVRVAVEPHLLAKPRLGDGAPSS